GKSRRLHDFPGVSVQIRKKSSISTVAGLFRLAQQSRSCLYSFGEYGIDLCRCRAIPGEGRAAKGLRPELRGKSCVLRKLIQIPQRQNHPAAIEERDLVAGCAKLPIEAKRLVEPLARRQVAHAECHRSQFRGRHTHANRLSCSEPILGAWKCSLEREYLRSLSPSFSQATSKRRPIIQA